MDHNCYEIQGVRNLVEILVVLHLALEKLNTINLNGKFLIELFKDIKMRSSHSSNKN